MKKISQIELVTYIDELDDKLNNKRYRDILYNEVLTSNKRKTNCDKRYKVIAELIRNNYQTQVGDATVWRVLRIKNESKKMFDEVKNGDIGIKTAFNELFGVNENKRVGDSAKLDIPNIQNIEDTLVAIKKVLEDNKDYFPNNKRLSDIDSKLFELRKTVNKIMQYNDIDNF